jgi:fimbrial chaperone protein
MRANAATLLGVLAAAGTAAASTLSVSPVRIELSPTVSTAVLTLRNPDDAPVTVQASPAAWSQQDQQDQLADTHDVLVTPPLFTIPPKGHQIVRVALLRKPDAARELDYRLVLAEIPPPGTAEGTGLRFALRITLPVFVAAPVHTAPELSWHHSWLADGTLRIEARNSGTAHIQVTDFDVQPTDAAARVVHIDAARYLLPGSSAHWELHPDGQSPRAGRIVIRGHSDAADFNVSSDSGPP